MSKIRIEKDIYLRDKHNVKRREWLAGQIVDSYIYHSVLRTNTPVNPEDLPVEPNPEAKVQSLHSKPMETKVLPEEPKEVEVAEVVEEPVAKAPAKRGRKKVKK